MRKHADGAWYTKDGQGRVRLTDTRLWIAEHMITGGTWSYIGLAKAKQDAINYLRNHRQFIW